MQFIKVILYNQPKRIGINNYDNLVNQVTPFMHYLGSKYRAVMPREFYYEIKFDDYDYVWALQSYKLISYARSRK